MDASPVEGRRREARVPEGRQRAAFVEESDGSSKVASVAHELQVSWRLRVKLGLHVGFERGGDEETSALRGRKRDEGV